VGSKLSRHGGLALSLNSGDYWDLLRVSPFVEARRKEQNASIVQPDDTLVRCVNEFCLAWGMQSTKRCGTCRTPFSTSKTEDKPI
jgi:hypothetical protein